MAILAERSQYLKTLTSLFDDPEGHTVFLMGEAGIGKTSLVNHFLKQLPKQTTILIGGCDPLSTPRPLGPLYDIAARVSPSFYSLLKGEKTRHIIFSALIDELSQRESVVIVFEDIHWADEATIDLIKFLSRRIYRYNILFLVTYRDDEINALKNIFGELIPHTFSKIQLQRLSQQAVQQLATQHGNRSGRELYELTGGNPFYVTEILANKESSIPDRVKDSILTVFNSKDDNVRSCLEFLSILPARIEQDVMDRLEAVFPGAPDICLSQGILIYQQKQYSFKHELFRITIEESLSPTKKRSLHKKILALISRGELNSISLSQRVHHAQYADERELVSEIAPRAAEEASGVGAHVEASKLYAIAIKFAGNNATNEVALYERHAYECYLTNQIPQAIESQEKALGLWRKMKSSLDEGNALRFLSRLWWYGGNRANAVLFADEAITILENGFPTRERTLAYSNLAQLYMLADDRANALLWGHRATDLAGRMDDKEIVCHALNNIGSVMMRFTDSEKEGEEILRRSLSLALHEGFHEHVARAYTNLCFALVLMRRYREAEVMFANGFKYCEDRDLNSWVYYMQSERLKLLLDTGQWDEAESNSITLAYQNHPAIIRIAALVVLSRIRTRKGNFDEARKLIADARSLAGMTGEAQRIVPVLVAQLELCWIAGDEIPLKEISEAEDNLFSEKKYSYHYFRLTQWMQGSEDTPYEKAIATFDLRTLELLGATATIEKVKSLMKEQGVTIPRGLRESTKTNPFQLTNRQIDVLNLLSEGLQNTEIADRLFISVKTVDHHISAILSKLGVNSRTRAVAKARDLELLK
jgi:DNA-binding CsgD family transcriptional regulator/tetratricopeptide (TPR) repeat protein